jgi:serine phosphatase RsbU (regulator of sigma subunit)
LKSPWNWSFGTKLTMLIFALIVASVGGSTIFFLQLYKKDKLSAVFQTEVSNTTQVAGHLENLLSLARVIDVDKAKASKNIIYLVDSPCDPTAAKKGVISDLYQKHFDDLEITPQVWTESLELFKVCSTLNTNPLAPLSTPQNKVVIVPTKVQMMQPYIVALIRGTTGDRLAVLSMDGFTTSAANTLFLTDGEGNILWSADGEDFLKKALVDTGLKQKDILKFSQDAIESGVPSVLEAGTDGLVSYVKVGEEWAIISLSYEPTTLQPVYYATTQSVLLALGFAFLCLFLGKRSAILVTRPLNELRLHAERLGQGNFESRIEVTGDDEISVVKAAFNLMTEKIITLIEDTKSHAAAQQELQLAEQIQQMLIPDSFLKRETYQIASYLQSANHCGGDWWGCVELERPNQLPLVLIMIGDVTGHGTASALVTATVRGGLSILESWLKSGLTLDPRAVNRFFNTVVFQAAKGSIGMTFFTAVIDAEKNEIYCCNAGHNFPYMLTPDETGTSLDIKSVGKSSVPLGYAGDTVYEDIDTYPWPPGSRIFLYTDGLIECMKDDVNLYDRKQLRKALKANGELTANKMLSKILAERDKRIDGLPPEDDVTVVVVEALHKTRIIATEGAPQ